MPPRQAHRSTMVTVFALALALRAGWGLYRMHAAGATALEFPDEEQYWLLATSLHDGAGLVDELGFRAGRMPLYPGLVSLVAGSPQGIAVVRVAQWFIGALGAVLALVLGTRIGGRTIGLLAAAAFTVDPFLVFCSNLVLTETLFVTLLMALWSYGAYFVVERRHPTIRQWSAAGVLSLACVYARESTLGLIGVALIAQLFWRRFDRSAWAGMMIVGCVLAAGLFPWALRNRMVIGQWCWLTTRAGISLYDGVGPQATGASDLGDVKNSAAVRGLTEVQWDRYFLQASFAEMRAEPGRVVKLALRKFLRMWNPVPNAADYRSPAVRLVSTGWMVPMLLLALAGVFVLRPTATAHAGGAVIYLLLPALYLSVLHMVFIGSVRYRLGAMPMLMVLAAAPVQRLWAAARARRTHAETQGPKKESHAEAQR
ncbi:MAG: hypothetical protein V2A79_18745 [Planctomycetota bacterium]